MPLTTAERKYKFEVAFSFLKQDESLAHQINDLIHDRLETFIYTEQQKLIVGTDGVETYTRVFLEEARIVVVLYREEWGTTPFTRIEENAIKQRNSEEWLDFIVFISLDKKKPKWVSKTNMWYDLDRWGIKPAAAIIEKRVSEYGGQIREETVVDQAARHKREIIRNQKREEYLVSREGLTDIQNEINQLLLLAEKNIDEIIDADAGLNFGKKKSEIQYGCFAEGIGLTFKLYQRWSNTLRDSHLEIFIAPNSYYDPYSHERGSVLKKEEYIFYLNDEGTKGWVRKKDKEGFNTTEQLVTYWQKYFLERTRKERLKSSKEHSGY